MKIYDPNSNDERSYKDPRLLRLLKRKTLPDSTEEDLSSKNRLNRYERIILNSEKSDEELSLENIFADLNLPQPYEKRSCIRKKTE